MKRLLLSLVLVAGLAPTAHAGRIAPALEAYMDTLSGTDPIKVLVTLQDPPDVDIQTLDLHLHLTAAPMATRHQQVIDTLRDAADRTQGPILAELDRQRSSGQIFGYTPYWIVNGIVMSATVDAVRALALRDDVAQIEGDLVVELIEPVPSKATNSPEFRGSGGLVPGIAAIEADRVWTELGIDGTGALIGGLDTGVDGNHVSMAARWRGNFAPSAECWNDQLGTGTTFPTDTHGHGTHTMGTMTGQTASDSIGVAPGALWIADNSINQGVGSGFDSDILNALQWFADPDGNSLTLDDVPDVVQNSWGINEGFSGGYTDCDSRWWGAMDNCEAAGVVLTWSAGNEGPGSQTLRSPGDRADTPYNAFSVGATSKFAPYNIASFSSRGPSGCGGPYAIKPEVSAPGVDTWSAKSGGGYQFLSGTSMAGPHVAGVVALMRAANPNVDVETVKQVLMDTAIDLGAAGEDNTYGHGFINAYEAVLAVIAGYGSIEGNVTDAGTTNPIQGVTVTITGGLQSDVTDASGYYKIILPPDDYTLNYSAFGYVSDSDDYTVSADATTNGDIALTAAATARLYGTVRDFTSSPVSGASVTVLNTPLSSVTTAGDGTYEIFVPDLAAYDVRATKSGLAPDEHSVAMSGDTTQDFTLQEITYEGFETGDFTLLPWTFSGNAPWTITTSDFHEPTHSARGGVISHNQTTNMQIQVELASGGDVTFWYKVSSEATYDFLRFDIDGVQQQAWSGTIGWTQASFPVSSGTHTFRWRYTKDASVNTGSDTGWVDEVVLPPLFNPATDAPSVVGTPLAFQLGRAFPNPTQGQSSIAFSVPQSGGNVDLSVFDVSGRRVRTLVSGTQAPGHHTVIWDGTDSTGNRTAAGTYFYRLRANDFEQTERLVRLQ